MNRSVASILILCASLAAACNKNYVPPVSGTISGQPALTLYGSSKDPSDYMFLSTALKKISYNGQVIPYNYSTSHIIYLNSNGFLVATCTLDTLPAPVTLTVDTSYGTTFGSKTYTAK